MEHKATYSPDDNKLRMYPACRLDKEDYLRFKNAGFKWAPMQKIFVAPMWTPKREDLLLEFCGEIGDEDTSLVDRAEERAERFGEYSEKRLQDAEAAKNAVSDIADNIPMGQPILVGHHSEKRARKDAERIENGMKKAVKLWETSQYWTDRAKGALRHAKYKEQPEVRARRIKKIEAEIRKMKASYTPKNPDEIIQQERYNCPVCGKPWDCDHPEAKEKIPHVYCGASRGGSWVPVENLPKIEAYYKRWIDHCEKRLMYEKALLGEQGKLDLLEKPKRPKQLPLLNYRAPDGITIENRSHKGEFSVYQQIEMTKAEYSRIHSDDKGTDTVENSHRVRVCMRRTEDGFSRFCVFLTDSKTHEKPEPVEKKQPDFPETIKSTYYVKPEKTEFDEMKEALKNGVKTVTADQLFVTPPDLAQKVVDYADLEPGLCVLEPSGGTGNLIAAILGKVDTEVVTCEVNRDLCRILENKFPCQQVKVFCKDFMEWPEVYRYERIVMNPPFKNGEDIKHIKRAYSMLSPGGKLVAICANGPRQRDQLMDMATHWEDLPEGSFKTSGTMVNAAIVVIDK